MRFKTCIIIGLGGTGGYLCEPLGRLMLYHRDGAKRLILIDGDAFDAGNMRRQAGATVGAQKATVAARRVRELMPNLDVVAIDAYVDRFSLAEIIDGERGTVLIVGSVDTHASRREIRMALEGRESFAWLSPGNALDRGQCLLYLRRGGQDATLDPMLSHPEIAHPSDELPGGCAAKAPSAPQLLAANMLSAAWTVALASALLDDAALTDEVSWHARQWRAGPGETVAAPRDL